MFLIVFFFRICPSTDSEETLALLELGVGAVRTTTREDPYIDRPKRGQAHLAICRLVQHNHWCVNAKPISDQCPQVGRCISKVHGGTSSHQGRTASKFLNHSTYLLLFTYVENLSLCIFLL